MAILKQTLNVNGNLMNSPKKEITVTLDNSIAITDINSILPNNGSKYDNNEIQLIPSGSSATILSIDTMYVCTFIAEGSVDGKWECIGKIPYITT